MGSHRDWNGIKASRKAGKRTGKKSGKENRAQNEITISENRARNGIDRD